MAVLSEADRHEVWMLLMQLFPPGMLIPIDKLALRRCVDAYDTVLNNNAATLNQQTQSLEPTWNQLAIPVRSQIATAVQRQRYEKGT